MKHDRGRGKRQWVEREEFVDDLAHAAQFAIAPQFSAPVDSTMAETSGDDHDADTAAGNEQANSTLNMADDDEIDVDDSDDDDDDHDDGNRHTDNGNAKDTPAKKIKQEKSGGELEVAGKDNGNGNTASSQPQADNGSNADVSDDESEVDLAEALAKMIDEDGGAPSYAASSKGASKFSASAPRTENELIANPYQTPLDELEQAMKINLTVAHPVVGKAKKTDDDGTGGDENDSGSDSDDDDDDSDEEEEEDAVTYSLAGTVRGHMVQNRTLIVVSSCGTTDIGLHQEPLDEGSLLVLRTDEGDIIPLGKIFEVFGPISQPLYSVRLPSPPTALERSSKSSQKKGGSSSNKNKPNQADTKQNGDSEKPEETKEIDAEMEDGSATAGPPSSSSNRNGNNSNGISDNASQGDATADTSGTATEMKDANESEGAQKVENMSDESKEAEPEAVDACAETGKDGKAETTKQEDANTTNAKTGADTDTDAATMPAKKLVDPWSSTGEYTILLQNTPRIHVYFPQGEVKRIDTKAVIKTSGKGCDASNIFDEEVVNANEMYYSDDEKEREAKSGKRKGRGKVRSGNHHNNNNGGNSNGGGRGRRSHPGRGRQRDSGPSRGERFQHNNRGRQHNRHHHQQQRQWHQQQQQQPFHQPNYQQPYPQRMPPPPPPSQQPHAMPQGFFPPGQSLQQQMPHMMGAPPPPPPPPPPPRQPPPPPANNGNVNVNGSQKPTSYYRY